MSFLQRYDVIYRAVNEAIDMNNNDLVLLVRTIASTGSLSINRRKKLLANGHKEALIDAAVDAALEALADLQ